MNDKEEFWKALKSPIRECKNCAVIHSYGMSTLTNKYCREYCISCDNFSKWISDE